MRGKKNEEDEEEFFLLGSCEEFEKFYEQLGEKIKLKDWTGFSGALNTTENDTGVYSVFVIFEQIHIMFHVSSLLGNKYIERKRHISNDIVVVIFSDEKDFKFKPTSISTNVTRLFFFFF